ncbi:hypothetical protein Scep_024119 [Stephania cephalantha]|uniref:Uncharacterized protein n=1 Tax=Stephania cephalantha TaxID=152367 RepID=A0AAP0F4W0_9MAGN
MAVSSNNGAAEAPLIVEETVEGMVDYNGQKARRLRSGGLVAIVVFSRTNPSDKDEEITSQIWITLTTVIAGVATLVFGPKKLSDIGRSLDQTVKSFQKLDYKLVCETKMETYARA